MNQDKPFITLDLYSKLQSMASGNMVSEPKYDTDSVKLGASHTSFFDTTRIYDRILRRKQQNNWNNLVIRYETIVRLLKNNDWYALYMPRERLNLNNFHNLRELEQIAVDLITEYADQFWREQRRCWESENIEVVTLGEEDRNNIQDIRVIGRCDGRKNLLWIFTTWRRTFVMVISMI